MSAKTRPGADCGSDHKPLIAKFKLKLKKVDKTTRPFRYDLNQIPYDYTVEVRNRFKGLDLIQYLMNYGWRFVTLYRRQGSRPSPWKWNAKVGSQETPGVTGKFGLGIWNEAGQRLIEFCQKNALVITNTLFQQHKRRLYTWTSPNGQHRNQTDYILCRQRWRSLSLVCTKSLPTWRNHPYPAQRLQEK